MTTAPQPPGPHEPWPRFYLVCGATGRSVLRVAYLGATARRDLQARVTAVLILLSEAFDQDEGADEAFRGFRKQDDLIAAYALLPDRNYIEEPSLRQYVARVRAAVRACQRELERELGRSVAECALIETRRDEGYRLVRRLVIQSPKRAG